MARSGHVWATSARSTRTCPVLGSAAKLFRSADGGAQGRRARRSPATAPAAKVHPPQLAVPSHHAARTKEGLPSSPCKPVSRRQCATVRDSGTEKRSGTAVSFEDKPEAARPPPGPPRPRTVYCGPQAPTTRLGRGPADAGVPLQVPPQLWSPPAERPPLTAASLFPHFMAPVATATCKKKLQKELREFLAAPPPHIPLVAIDERYAPGKFPEPPRCWRRCGRRRCICASDPARALQGHPGLVLPDRGAP